MRLLVSGTLLLFLSLPVFAQASETGEGGDDNAPRAQPAVGDPGASQDAEAAREKLLKSANQVDLIESNAEATKASVDGLKTQVTRLQNDNATLKQQVSTLQDMATKQQEELDKMQADRAKERQALIDEISSLVAAKTTPHHTHVTNDDAAPTPAPKKHAHADDDSTTASATKPDASLTPPPDTAPSGPTTTADSADVDDSSASTSAPAATSTAATAPTHPRKGYYHVVAPHETLSLICEAYRDHGVNVTVAQIRHANGLTSKSALKVGQKLFIPKPGT